MLTVYRRHRANCPNAADRYVKRDRCCLWVEGTVEGRYIRRTLKTRSWERADELKRELESGSKPKTLEAVKIPTIAEAADKFLAGAVVKLERMDVDFAREFRASWTDGAISSVKKLERYRAFCRFCATAGWIASNPATSVSRPATKTPPTLPLSDNEIAKALEHAHDARWHALILVLRWSGLRIGDAMKLTSEKLDRNKLLLYTAKTGTPVYVPLPEFVLNELEKLPHYGGYFFWNRAGESKIDTAAGNARRALRRIFKDAGVKNAHPHRLRDSFAVGLLEKGVPIETVSMLLGHADSRVTTKHYRPWVRSLQENLEKAVSAAWPKAKLERVK